MNQIQEVIRSAEQLLGNLPELIYIKDLNNQIIWGNIYFQKQFGYNREKWDNKLSHLLTMDSPTNTIEDIRKEDGSFISLKQQLTPIYDNEHNVVAYSGMLREIKQGDLHIEEAEKYKIVAENTTDITVLVDNRGIVQYTSPSIYQGIGYSQEEYLGIDAFDIIYHEDRNRVRSAFLEVLQSKKEIDIEYRLVHKQGNTVFAETKVKPVLDCNGDVKYVVAVVRDITNRKNTEILLENILESVNAAVWSTDKDFTRYSFCSESIEKITGIPRSEIMDNPIRLHDHIHPDDNEMLVGEVKSLLDMGIAVNKVIRYTHIENEIRWGRLLVHPFLNQNGEILRLDGMMLDITDLKKSELALEESEQKYKSLFENNLDGVFSINLDGNFVKANQSFEKITGVQLNNLTNRCFMGLIFDEDHLLVNQVLSEVMTMMESRDVECRIRNVNIGERIMNITFVPIFLSGKLNGVHGIVKDITDRKREEKELIESEERYKILQHSINRFSNDLANVTKVSELEARLLKEIQTVLRVKYVTIEEVHRGQEISRSNEMEKWIKITEKENFLYLRMELMQNLLKVEEEWLETAVHYATILYDNLEFIENLMRKLEEVVTKNETPKWMLRLIFKLSEKERASLSSDLHDSVLQDLIIWYRKLESLRSSISFGDETDNELKQIEEGLLDAIHQIRITCNELRPPFLLKMGLDESLKSLFSYARMFANYEIEYVSEPLKHPLNEDQILGLYRIVQELLNNASKHSQATNVTIKLTGKDETIEFSYKDNGIGMDLTVFEGSFQNMGIAGIENRVLSLEGKVEINSAPKNGFHAKITIPTIMKQKGEMYGNIISG